MFIDKHIWAELQLHISEKHSSTLHQKRCNRKFLPEYIAYSIFSNYAEIMQEISFSNEREDPSWWINFNTVLLAEHQIVIICIHTL